MPLDEFKTQVLLLHSEQSTLDNLSSGFSDRYTVHCATSGSEALNTLVETPINVIITAQELPGMSGLEALREAKKRSPETIGILLAGSKTRDVEALVGDEEVFQVVSGNVTSDGLLQLVENATRQMRLMALAESANDTTAGVDEPAEHIVMETSENGSTIISSGTGRVPVLDPQKVPAAASVGSRSIDILVLTKDQEFLETMKDSSRGMHKVFYANTLGQANDAIRKHKIGVVVVDAAMVGEKIEQLTQHLRKTSPRLVSIVAGRRDDGEMLMDLINRGKVYRFLLKPVSPGRARLAVESSVKHHLEAPDAAFLAKGGQAAPAVAPKPVAKAPAKPKPAPVPSAKPAPQPAAKPVAKDAPKPTPANEAAPAAGIKNVPSDPPLGSDSVAAGDSPIEDGLSDAFGQDDTSFAETMTGLIGTVTDKFSSDTKDAATSSPGAPGLDSALPGDTGSDGSVFTNPKIMGVAAAAIVVVVAGLFWALGGSDESTPLPVNTEASTPSIVESRGVFNEAPLETETVGANSLATDARLATETGRVFSPPGDNAVELFAAALAADPNNANIAAELDAVVAQALSTAETAMLESQLDDASAALASVTAATPNNARLPFLSAQLSQMQLRGHLDSARTAIRENLYEDAAVALSAARGLSVSDTTEIDAISAELRAARSAQQVDDVLARAIASLDAGNLMAPANDNARYYYELVLSNDPGNSAARQGLSVIAGKLAFQARTEIDNGDLNLAENTLANARALDRSNTEVAAATTELSNKRAAIVQERRQAAEAQRVAQENAAAEARRQATLQQEQAAAENLTAQSSTADNAESESRPAVEAAVLDTGLADNAIADPAAAAGSATGPSAINDNDVAPAATSVADQKPIAISQLNRTKYVSPKYPRSAQRRNLSGWVDLVFTVTTDGTVSDIDIRSSEPGDTFVSAATKAVGSWEFEPIVENGVAVEKRAGVRMMFALE